MPGFFALTTMGSPEPIREANINTNGYNFHAIAKEDYISAFKRFLMGKKSWEAETLGIDGASTVLRASLGDMLRFVLNRQPRKFELEAWFTNLEYDRGATMGIDEYLRGIQKLCAVSMAPQQPCEYTSFNQRRSDCLRHVRVSYDPQNSIKAPLTTQQEVGWHSPKQAPALPSIFATRHSDVTTKEGRDLKFYYGGYS